LHLYMNKKRTRRRELDEGLDSPHSFDAPSGHVRMVVRAANGSPFLRPHSPPHPLAPSSPRASSLPLMPDARCPMPPPLPPLPTPHSPLPLFHFLSDSPAHSTIPL
jgi:hypothetical protein